LARGNKQIAEAGKNTRFKKGQSGNPGGNPKGIPDVATMIKMIGREPIDAKSKKTKIEGIVRKAFEDAIAGNDKARQFIVDRGWGKAVDKIAMTDSEGKDAPGAIAMPVLFSDSLASLKKKIEE